MLDLDKATPWNATHRTRCSSPAIHEHERNVTGRANAIPACLNMPSRALPERATTGLAQNCLPCPARTYYTITQPSEPLTDPAYPCLPRRPKHVNNMRHTATTGFASPALQSHLTKERQARIRFACRAWLRQKQPCRVSPTLPALQQLTSTHLDAPVPATPAMPGLA